MRTIERNYRKNPHTASFLQTFHSGISSTGRNYREEMAAETDLLDSVPVEHVADLRSPGQVELMDNLIGQITELDATAGAAAKRFQDGVTERGTWTPGREGNASEWIRRMIAKVSELRGRQQEQILARPVRVEDGRYAVEHNGTLKFFRVKNGRKPGFVFLDVQASDDWHAIRNLTVIREILALIAQDAKAAMIRYGRELGECGSCGRTLTDEASRKAGIGPICAGK